MPRFPIGFWNYEVIARQGPEAVKDWVDCGMTLAMGPCYGGEPGDAGKMRAILDEAHKAGAILIFDEITIGWRLALGGAHLRYGVSPDIAVFAKALGNGHPAAAVIGRAGVMQAAQRSFISSTYWTEGVGSAAALATVRKMQRVDVPAHVARVGVYFQRKMSEVGARHEVPLKLAGHPAVTTIAFDHADSLALRTLMVVRMLERGILAGGQFSVTLAHSETHVDRYAAAADEIFAELADAVHKGDVAQRIGGRAAHSGFARLT